MFVAGNAPFVADEVTSGEHFANEGYSLMTRMLQSPLALFCTAVFAVLLADPIGANSEVSACRTGTLACSATCRCHVTSVCTVGVRASAGPEREKADLVRVAEGGGASGATLWFHPVGPWLDFAR